MARGISFAGPSIVRQMEIDRIASTVGASDSIDGAIRLYHARPRRLYPHGRILRNRRHAIAPANVYIMDPTIDTVDHHIMTVPMLVGEASLDQPTNNRFADLCRYHLLDARTVQTACRQLALHEADNVTAFAHAAERIVHPVGKTVAPAADILRKLHRLQLAQPPGRHRLLERLVVGGRYDPIGIHPPKQPPVDRRQPLLLDIMAQAGFDFVIGPRPQVERHQFGRALP